ncbi:UNVERIFIED_CONTAM: hypothetical protein Sangu_0385500 [Sesamum angustifolium]|uniref:Uncharacterized protein n=1 Tax=Sesamum angustifolium TaxID=2727405 RepID=A0AAW2QSI9_9LAMI
MDVKLTIVGLGQTLAAGEDIDVNQANDHELDIIFLGIREDEELVVVDLVSSEIDE